MAWSRRRGRAPAVPPGADGHRPGPQVPSRGPQSDPQPPAEWLTIALEEYRALRAEIVEAIQAQRTIMQVGTTGVAVLIGFGLQRIGPFPSVMILTVLVPAVAIFTTVGALGELFR